MSETPTGLTKDTGWQIGARRTLNVDYQEAWRFLTSAEGLAVWLGAGATLPEEYKQPYQLKDGTTGELRVFKPNSHLRLTWQPPEWEKASTIQLRVMPKKNRCVIAFHQENLPDETARETRKVFYQHVLDQLEVHF